jgi:hypothetical protein
LLLSVSSAEHNLNGHVPHYCSCRDANRVNEEWFTDMDKVRAAVGMVDEAPEPSGNTDKVRRVAL